MECVFLPSLNFLFCKFSVFIFGRLELLASFVSPIIIGL